MRSEIGFFPDNIYFYGSMKRWLNRLLIYLGLFIVGFYSKATAHASKGVRFPARQTVTTVGHIPMAREKHTDLNFSRPKKVKENFKIIYATDTEDEDETVVAFKKNLVTPQLVASLYYYLLASLPDQATFKPLVPVTPHFDYPAGLYLRLRVIRI
ncbi:hypothetical protein SAMN05660909_04613 [Chitinophaga terrae (ex Kim and Jung 2007)]|uniref:Uncharacterized protein n=2 Tax=Chitinophaga terrae (ex Kim and Jung 2007) TaxID=408074 RepID=A0A1H4FQG0_9BACT|nr:hypothetical protein SAMN05660909_04613 [Chitinophaga terrae (ex Kim and Jung 2007)]